ncbi:MAG: hypothetical protein NTV79_08645 [Candidatus Aureabacteria bacterium]|nr:hypothetical protein [Candidatus Auribacterota bacterium]
MCRANQHPHLVGGPDPDPLAQGPGPAAGGHRQGLGPIQSATAVASVTLQPRSAAARKFMDAIEVAVHTNDFSLAWTELRFTDGSRMRNEFFHGALNAPLPQAVFAPAWDPAFTVVEPLRQ